VTSARLGEWGSATRPAVSNSATIEWMTFPIKTCVACGEEFELRPGKPGFANRCPACSEPDSAEAAGNFRDPGAGKEQTAARRSAMGNLLYRKDS
jgi:hypothetical protein